MLPHLKLLSFGIGNADSVGLLKLLPQFLCNVVLGTLQ